jgi:hypothetical protein
MKRTILLLIGAISASSYGQVGIGTTAPQETLHLGARTSTIRVEGLDEINNPLNSGPTQLTPVFVTESGNFTLQPAGYTSGGTGYVLPLNFLADTPNLFRITH